MKQKRKETFSEMLGEEIINELMIAGFAVFLIVFGVNYFHMKWAWTEIIAKASEATGLSHTAAGIEAANMLSALAHTFPFNLLFVHGNSIGVFIIAIFMTVVGFTLKAFTVKSRGKFIKDLGKVVYIPAVIGFVVIIILQLWTAFNVDDYMATHDIARPEFEKGFFIWQTYGQLFLLGAALLVIGAVIKLVAEQNQLRKVKLLGDTMFNGSILLLFYYFIIRILALDVLTQTAVGKVLKLFIISNQTSSYTIIVCVFLFTFGRALKQYGIDTMRQARKEKQLKEMKDRYEFMGSKYGAKHIPRTQPPHPKRLQVSEHDLHHEHKHHPYAQGHRYTEQEKNYRK
jgi:hypothetical protein